MAQYTMQCVDDHQLAFDIVWNALRKKNLQISRMYDKLLTKDLVIHELLEHIIHLQSLLESLLHSGDEEYAKLDEEGVFISPEEAEPKDWDWDDYWTRKVEAMKKT